MGIQYRDLETIIPKIPFHLVKRVRRDFENAKKNVQLVRYEMYIENNKHGENLIVTGYDVRGRSYSVVYNTQKIYRSDIDERG